MAKDERWFDSFQVAIQIKNLNSRAACMESVGSIYFKKYGYNESSSFLKKVQNSEIVSFFKIGIIKSLDPINIDKNILVRFLKELEITNELSINILETYFLNQLFFDKKNVIDMRFNKTLNLQWAIEINDCCCQN